jgi:hypothetical protein
MVAETRPPRRPHLDSASFCYSNENRREYVLSGFRHSHKTLDLVEKTREMGFDILEICVEDPKTIDKRVPTVLLVNAES